MKKSVNYLNIYQKYLYLLSLYYFNLIRYIYTNESFKLNIYQICFYFQNNKFF